MFRKSVRIVAIVVAVVTATLVAPDPAGAGTSTPAVATAASPTAVDVSWTAPPLTVDRWVISARTVLDKVIAGVQTLCGTCFSTRFEFLMPGTSYGFLIVGLGGEAGDGVWAYAGATTPADPLCASGTACIAVNSTTTLGPVTQVGLGINQGVTDSTDATRIAALKLNYRRISAYDERNFKLARSTGGQISASVSGAWRSWTTTTYGVAKDPWDDWAMYRLFVGNLVKWHTQKGILPEYWEIQNEPDQAPWYFGTTSEPNVDLVLQQFQVAHDAIRAVLPTAKIVGPSVGSFDDTAKAVISLRTVLQYAASHGVRFDVVSWHELGGDCWGQCDAGPRGIVAHLATLKSLLAQYPALGQPEVHINEYGDAAIYSQPGAAVGYFAALAYANVQRAASGCWPATYDGVTYKTCYANPGMADGVLMPDGTTPTPRWFVWRSYAQMTGSRLASSVARADMSVLAAKTTTGTIRVLVGRHAETATTDTAMPIRLKTPTATTSYRVTVSALTPASTTEVVTDLGMKRAVSGMLDLGTFTFANGASLSLTLTPA